MSHKDHMDEFTNLFLSKEINSVMKDHPIPWWNRHIDYEINGINAKLVGWKLVGEMLMLSREVLNESKY